MTRVKDVAAGGYHTMVLKTDGTLWATGRNRYGQLGDGTNTDKNNKNRFSQVMTGVKDVAAGGDHTMVVKTDGTLWVTGYNWSGQLGDGTNTNKNRFAQVMAGV